MVFSSSRNALLRPAKSGMDSSDMPPSDTPVPLLHWGAQTLADRGMVQPFRLNDDLMPAPYNAIGTRRGTGWSGNAMHRALQLAQPSWSAGPQECLPMRQVSRESRADMAVLSAPHPAWFGSTAPVSLDPFGAAPAPLGGRPTITAVKTQLRRLELESALEHGWLEADGTILQASGQLQVTRVTIAPVWYLPGVAHRLQVDEAHLRQRLYQQTDGLFPDLIQRPDLSVFLPPMAETTADILGPVTALRSRTVPLALHLDRREEEPLGYVTHAGRVQALETCIEVAQAGGIGVILGLPPRQVAPPLLDPATVVHHWELQLMPDVLHWLGISRIDQFLSVSYDCSDQLTRAGVEIVQQVALEGMLSR